MLETSELLPDLPGSIETLDLDPSGAWVAACRSSGRLAVASSFSRFSGPDDFHFPLVRWLPNGNILLVNARTAPGRENAHVFSSDGAVTSSFYVGDAVADVLSVGDDIVITYFDEGVFSDHPPSREGLAVFQADGTFRFGYRSHVPNAVEIADCYCACVSGRNEVSFLPYTDFPVVRLNLRTLSQQVFPTAEILAGASALSASGPSFYFFAPYDADRGLFRWRPGDSPVLIGEHTGPLRGLPSGVFLSTGLSGYSLVRDAPA